MALVTGLTAARMLAIEAASIVDGNVVGDNLILTKHDGTPIDAGNVRGPQGDTGDTGDTGIAGADAAFRVRVATTGNISQSGTNTVDGVPLFVGDLILCKNQTAPAQNGIWVISAGAWTRADNANSSSEIAGAIVLVQEGTANGGHRWTTNFKSSNTLGTTGMNWYRLLDGTNAVLFDFTGTTDSSGFLTVTHGLGFTPSAVYTLGGNPATSFAIPWGLDTITATTFRMRFMNASSAGLLNALSVGTQRAIAFR